MPSDHAHKHEGGIHKKKSTKKKHKKKRSSQAADNTSAADTHGHHHGKKWKTAPDADGHHNEASRKAAQAKAARAAIVASKRNEKVEPQHLSALRKQAIAINRTKFAHPEKNKRVRVPGPRPSDLPPRLKLGMRYDEESIVSLYDAVLHNDVKTITSVVTEVSKEASRLQGQYPRGTLLHLAAHKGSEEIISHLLKNGGDVNSVDELGNIPLHRATVRGDVKIIKLILTYDVKETKKQLVARNIDGLTVVQLATQHSLEKIRSTYINHMKLEKLEMSAEDRMVAASLVAHEKDKEAAAKARAK